MHGNTPEKRIEIGVYTSQVATRVASMYAGLKTYGKEYNGSVLQAWLFVLNVKEITLEEIERGGNYYLLRGTEVPTAGEFATWCLEDRERHEVRCLLDATNRQIAIEREQHKQQLRDLGYDPDALIGKEKTRELQSKIGALN